LRGIWANYLRLYNWQEQIIRDLFGTKISIVKLAET